MAPVICIFSLIQISSYSHLANAVLKSQVELVASVQHGVALVVGRVVVAGGGAAAEVAAPPVHVHPQLLLQRARDVLPGNYSD